MDAVAGELLDQTQQQAVIPVVLAGPPKPKANHPPIRAQPPGAPGRMDDGLEDLSRHDGALDAVVLETANGSTELGDAGPVKTVDEAHQLRGGRVPDADTHHRNAGLTSFFGKENRKPSGAGK